MTAHEAPSLPSRPAEAPIAPARPRPSSPDDGDRVVAARALLPRLYSGEDITPQAHTLAEQARHAGDVPGECAALYAALAAASIAEETSTARTTAATIVQRAAHGRVPVWESVGRQYLARLHLADRHEDLALSEVVEAELLVDDAGDDLQLAIALNGIAIAYLRLGLFEDSERVYERLYHVAHTAGDHWSQVALVHNRLLNRASWSLALLRNGEEEAARERLATAARQTHDDIDVSDTPARHDVGALLLFAELMTGAVSTDVARRRFEILAEHTKGEAVSFVRFGLAYRLVEEGHLDAARDEVAASLTTVHPVDGEPVHTMLRWLQARVALLEDPGNPGLQDVGRYAELTSQQVWELRERRREAVQERLRIARMRREHEHIERVSLEDPLTGAANRRLIDRERAALLNVDEDTWTTVVYLDLDHFKLTNDEHGHEVGDAVLRSLATLLERTTRDADLVGRYGGDEFVVIAPDCAPEEAERLGQRLLTAIRAHDGWPAEVRGRISASLGLATARGPQSKLFVAADHALYQSKTRGRDQQMLRVLDPEP
ncbi:MAG: GGDEF domain-containing protein [Nitriliruptoraceae bacterium]